MEPHAGFFLAQNLLFFISFLEKYFFYRLSVAKNTIFILTVNTGFKFI